MAPSRTARLKVITNSVFEIVDSLLADEVEDIEAEEWAGIEILNKLSMKRKRIPPEEKNIDHYYVELNLSLDDFSTHFKMSRTTMETLVLTTGSNVLKQMGIRKGGRPIIPPSKQIMLIVWMLVNPETFRSIARRFHVSLASCHACMKRVCEALTQHASRLITWPEPDIISETSENIRESSSLSGVLGVIDTIHIRIRQMDALTEAFRNRKNEPTIILQAVCNHTLAFIDCYAGQLGSISDDKVYHCSDLHQRVMLDSQSMFPDGTYMVGDPGYPLDIHLLTPFHDDGTLSAKEQVFNACLYRAHELISRAFRLLMSRFRRLHNLDMARVDLIPSVIIACCVMHNICIRGNEVLEEEEIDLSYRHKETCVVYDYSPDDGLELNRNEGLIKRRNIVESLVEEVSTIWACVETI